MAGNSLDKNMRGLELLVQIGKFLAILSRHTGWVDPGLRAIPTSFSPLL